MTTALVVGAIGLLMFFVGAARDSDALIGFGWLLMIVSFVYFLPDLIAFYWHWATAQI